MTNLIIKSNIKKKIIELQKDNVEISSVAEEVEQELEHKAENILIEAIQRAKSNQRRTLLARDL